jgi:transcriptional regulator with XRE-family HTH domain
MPIDQTTARENTRRLILMRGMTIKELAERAGVSKETLYGWSKRDGPKDLGAKSIAAIAEALGVTTEALFSPDLAGQGEALAQNASRAHTPANVTADEDTRRSALREIDYLLASIDDPDEQERAADIILAALRAARDSFERRRAASTGQGRAGIGPARGGSRGPRRT